jgi:hypothetical protein
MGIRPHEFDEMTIGELFDYTEGYKNRVIFQVRERDAVNRLLGQYVGIAVNSPKKYPKKPFLAKEKEEKKFNATTDAQRIRYARNKYRKATNGNNRRTQRENNR